VITQQKNLTVTEVLSGFFVVLNFPVIFNNPDSE
jgi:hypothetical protein